MTFAESLGVLLSSLDQLVSGASKYHMALVPTGRTFLGVAITLTLLNDWYQFWIKGDAQEMVARMFRLFVVASIPITIMAAGNNWDTFNNKLVSFFQSGVTNEITKAGGGSASDTISGTLQKMVDAVSVKPKPPQDSGGFDILDPDTWVPSIGDSISNAFSTMGVFITELVLKLIVWIGIALMALGMIVAGYIPLVALQVGVILGPLLVAWLPFEPMANYAHTWLKFMIVNAITFVVAITLLTIAAGTISSISGIVTSMFEDGAGLAGYMAGVFITLAVMIFIAYMLFQSDDIAGGLIGHSSVGGGYMGRAIASGGMGRALKAGGGVAGTGVSKVADKTAGIGAKAAAGIAKVTGAGNAVASAGEKMFYKGVEKGGVGGKMLMGAGNTLNKLGGSVQNSEKIKPVLNPKIGGSGKKG